MTPRLASVHEKSLDSRFRGNDVRRHRCRAEAVPRPWGDAPHRPYNRSGGYFDGSRSCPPADGYPKTMKMGARGSCPQCSSMPDESGQDARTPRAPLAGPCGWRVKRTAREVRPATPSGAPRPTLPIIPKTLSPQIRRKPASRKACPERKNRRVKVQANSEATF